MTPSVGSAMPCRGRGRGRHMVGKNASGANPTAGHPPARRATGRSPAAHGAQPVAVQASQQLGWFPAHALPPAGAWSVQAGELLLVLHFVVPLDLVLQQVTKPGFPHVERAAHFLTAPRHAFGSEVFAFTWCATHDTYCPWLLAVVQPAGGVCWSHAWSAAARAAST